MSRAELEETLICYRRDQEWALSLYRDAECRRDLFRSLSDSAAEQECRLFELMMRYTSLRLLELERWLAEHP